MKNPNLESDFQVTVHSSLFIASWYWYYVSMDKKIIPIVVLINMVKSEQFKLDVKDKKILSELDRNSIQTKNQIV